MTKTKRRKTRLPLMLIAAAAATALASAPHDTRAADHNDPIEIEPRPGDSVDPAADLADIFAWNIGEGDAALLNLALTWRADPLYEREFDPTIQFSIHLLVDSTGPLTKLPKLDALKDLSTGLFNQLHQTKDTHTIRVSFGKKKGSPKEWGARIKGLPGHDTVIGPVGEVFEPEPTEAAGSHRKVKVLAGVFDDAFFADKDGFFNGVSMTLGNTKLTPECKDRVSSHNVDAEPIPGKVKGGKLGDCNNPTSSWPNYPLLAKTPFGLNNKLDGFGLANMHGLVIQIPVEYLKLGSGDAHKKVHVWASSEGKVGRARSGHTFEQKDFQ